MRIHLILIPSVILTSANIYGDWRDSADFPQLQDYAGASLPDGDGLTVAMTEAVTLAGYFLPNGSSSVLSNTNIVNIDNHPATGTSSHATNVASRFYGPNNSLTPSVETANIRNATDFLSNFLGITGQVRASTEPVMSHAYIFEARGSLTIDQAAELIKRFDFFSASSEVINVIGMDNGNSDDIPEGWGAAYNSISVGLTDGNHSSGGTPADYENPGRQKPDIVVNETLTSWSTGAISSSSLLLIDKASEQSDADAVHPETIKAALLTGATKEEFPTWSQSSTAPLDTTFGAGEVNIFNSYRIIEQTNSATGSVFYRGWARNSVTTEQTRVYTFTTPISNTPLTLSSTLIWQRPVTETSSGFSTTYSYEDLPNLQLELLDSSNALIQLSDSALDNVEHIWNTELQPNTSYSLRVSSSSDSSDFSLAWRVDGVTDIQLLKPDTQLSISRGSSSVTLSSTNLIANTLYTVQRSTDLKTWNDITTFTPVSSTATFTDTVLPPDDEKIFYRLKYFLP